MVVCGARRRGVAPAARADGARVGHPPRARDAAAERRRADRRHQGELPGAHLVPGLVAHRLAHDPRPNGAEHLLGQGDMLFLPPGTSKLQRLHGAVRVGARGRAARRRSCASRAARSSTRRLLRAARGERGAGGARRRRRTSSTTAPIEIVAETRNASISYIQRRLKVGYNRAARMIEQMEHEGMVGPQDGTEGRARSSCARSAAAPNERGARRVGARVRARGALAARGGVRAGATPGRRRPAGGLREPPSPARCRRATTGSGRSARASSRRAATSRSAARAAAEVAPSRGRVEFAKPGRMRCEYEAPEPSLVVSDGKTLWIYDPTAKEVQVLAGRAGLPLGGGVQFLLGEGSSWPRPSR